MMEIWLMWMLWNDFLKCQRVALDGYVWSGCCCCCCCRIGCCNCCCCCGGGVIRRWLHVRRFDGTIMFDSINIDIIDIDIVISINIDIVISINSINIDVFISISITIIKKDASNEEMHVDGLFVSGTVRFGAFFDPATVATATPLVLFLLTMTILALAFGHGSGNDVVVREVCCVGVCVGCVVVSFACVGCVVVCDSYGWSSTCGAVTVLWVAGQTKIYTWM